MVVMTGLSNSNDQFIAMIREFIMISLGHGGHPRPRHCHDNHNQPSKWWWPKGMVCEWLHNTILLGGLVAIWYIFPYIGNFIIPIDVHIFRRGGPTTNQYWLIITIWIWRITCTLSKVWSMIHYQCYKFTINDSLVIYGYSRWNNIQNDFAYHSYCDDLLVWLYLLLKLF